MIERNYKREKNKNCIVPDEISFKINIEKSERKGYKSCYRLCKYVGKYIFFTLVLCLFRVYISRSFNAFFSNYLLNEFNDNHFIKLKVLK